METDWEYILELRTESKVGCDGVATVNTQEYRFDCTCQGRQCELSVNEGGNTGFNLVLSIGRGFIFVKA